MGIKKIVRVGVLLGAVALLLLAVGSAAADTEGAAGIEVEPEPGGVIVGVPNFGEVNLVPLASPLEGEQGQAVSAEGTATRIDFEQSEDSALEGYYIVQEVDRGMVAYWYAHDGWLDSGWINHVDITREAVHVRVLFYPAGSDAETTPTVMTIINHAPGSEYGWLADGMAHALEVEFPD